MVKVQLLIAKGGLDFFFLYGCWFYWIVRILVPYAEICMSEILKLKTKFGIFLRVLGPHSK